MVLVRLCTVLPSPQNGSFIRGIISRCQIRRVSQLLPTKDRQDTKKLWLLIIPVTTFCLGTWQIFRLQWKVGLIEELERKTMRPAVDIPTNIASRLDELEYCRVRLTGYYDHTRELLMWPRSLLSDGRQQSISAPGAHVITPFYCYELQSYILVNRGWVPKSRMSPDTRPNGQVEGDISLSALVRTQEKRAPFSPKNDPEHGRWSWRDVASMAAYVGTEPILVDADATTTLRGGPIGGQTRVTLRNEHLQYIFTWYSLSLLTAYMFLKLWRAKKR